MKRSIHFAVSLLALVPLPVHAAEGESAVATYRIEVSVDEDVFRVSWDPGPLDARDGVLRFVGYAPGAHSQLDFGRFVQGLSARDAEGAELPLEQLDVNAWQVASPERVARIDFEVEDTFDASVEGRVFPGAGSGIDAGYALLNPYAVLPYFESTLERPVRVEVVCDPAWTVATALERDEDGVLHAESYRGLVDRPLLLGELSSVSTWVGDIEVEIHVRSPAGALDAQEILYGAGEVLEAANAFLGFAPVDRYVFLMVFFGLTELPQGGGAFGALEHSTSSVYTLPMMGSILDGLPAIVAHEFMHVLTPLHLRSRMIANFDYSVPTTDQHLWLYEGLTEWTSGILRLRAGVIDLEAYLGEMSGKILAASRYDPDFGLERLSLEWSTDAGRAQYGNIYQLGALTAMLLDVRLLELSGGERGLREVYLELIGRYGRERPFDPDTFVDELVDATYPEIGEFFRDHVAGTVPLDYEGTLEAIGIELAKVDGRPSLRILEDASDEQLALRARWMRPLGE